MRLRIWQVFGMIAMGAVGLTIVLTVAKTNHRKPQFIYRDFVNLPPFDRIVVSDGFQIHVAIKRAGAVQLGPLSSSFPMLEPTVEGGKLILKRPEGSRPSQKYFVSVYAPKWSGIECLGETTISTGELIGHDLLLKVRGNGHITAWGHVDSLSVDIDGSGGVFAGSLKAKAAHVDLHGDGKAELWATGTLGVSIDGAGSVTYHGDGKVTSAIKGGGKLIRKGS